MSDPGQQYLDELELGFLAAHGDLETAEMCADNFLRLKERAYRHFGLIDDCLMCSGLIYRNRISDSEWHHAADNQCETAIPAEAS